MRKILVASRKGGCGKTTIAVNLAACWSQRGHAAALVDADPQASARVWADMRPEALAAVHAVKADRKALQRLAGEYAIAVIDTAAGTSPAQLAQRWLDQVDAVIVPVLPSGIDLDASYPYLEELAALDPVRRGHVPVAIVANRVRASTRATRDALAEMGDDFPFRVAAELRDSQAYVLLAGLGKSIFDYGSMTVRRQQRDWNRLQHWLHRHTRA